MYYTNKKKEATTVTALNIAEITHILARLYLAADINIYAYAYYPQEGANAKSRRFII